MKTLIKKINNKKFYYGFILGVALCISFTVSAAILVAANEVSLSSSKTSKTNVQDALDELYDKASVCITCSAGTYADNVLKQCILCTAGTYSTGNATSCSLCPTGYTSDQAATGVDQCYIETTAGKYIKNANDSEETNCTSGSYCPSTKVYYGTTGGNITCPDGYTSDESADSESKCYIETTAGKYIATAKSTTQSTCTAGFYCPSAKVYYGNTGQINACGSGKTSSSGSSSYSNCYSPSYTYTKTAPVVHGNSSNRSDVNNNASGLWIATYTCTNGSATITSCAYNGTYGNSVCTGEMYGYNNSAIPHYHPCTGGSGGGSWFTVLQACSYSLPEGIYVDGGNLPITESCN